MRLTTGAYCRPCASHPSNPLTRVSSPRLSELTAVAHLSNLRYLNIGFNQLEAVNRGSPPLSSFPSRARN